MKSLVVQEPEHLVIEERAMLPLADEEVRVRVNFAGICGSDLHILHGNNPFARYPRVIGHEFFGIIDAVGKSIDRQRIGQRVVIDPVISCGHCYPCSVNRPNVCQQLQVIGVHRDGGFSEYVNVPAQNAYEVPDGISDEQATLVEPFTIAANICEQVKPSAHDIALIYGAGPMGLTIIQALKNVYQVKAVWVADFVPERLTLAAQNGADLCLDNRETPLHELLSQQPTLIIDAACHPSILPEACQLASPAARIGILGFSDAPCVISQQIITGKELSLYSSRLNSNRFPLVINWLANKRIQPEKLITHRLHYEKINEAMEIFARDQAHCCKVILSFV